MTGTPNTLLVFFSRSGENLWDGGRRTLEVGNTKRVADMIAERIECDTFEITAADPYSDEFDSVDRRAASASMSASSWVARCGTQNSP